MLNRLELGDKNLSKTTRASEVDSGTVSRSSFDPDADADSEMTDMEEISTAVALPRELPSSDPTAGTATGSQRILHCAKKLFCSMVLCLGYHKLLTWYQGGDTESSLSQATEIIKSSLDSEQL